MLSCCNLVEANGEPYRRLVSFELWSSDLPHGESHTVHDHVRQSLVVRCYSTFQAVRNGRCSARDAAGAAMKTGVRARSLGEGGIFLRHVGATATVGDMNHDGTMR